MVRAPDLQRDGETVWRVCWRRRRRTALILGVIGFIYATAFLFGSGAFDLQIDGREVAVLAAAAILFVAVELPLAHRRARRFFEPVATWADTGGRPTETQFARLHALPFHHARAIALEWFVACAIAVGIHQWFAGFTAGQLLMVGIGGICFGLHMAWLVYLLVESGLQPEFASAAAEIGPDHVPTYRLSVRMVRTVVLVSGVVSFGAIVLLAWPGNEDEADLARAVVPLTLFVLIEGVGIMTWSIRSLSSTVVAMRDGLAAVESGDLTVHLPVTDRTELGALQHSFNQMVLGLRDRALLERLLAGQVGPGVARVSREHGSRLQGDRRTVSVLFVDLIGSTSLTRRLSPEAMVELLNGYFDVVVQRVTAHRGELLQFQGDGAICLFGAPNPLVDHEEHALRAARLLRADLDEFGSGHDDVRAAVAVSTGSTVVGHLGTDERHTYTAIGDAVNEACRLVEVAKRSPLLTVAAASTVVGAGDEAANWLRAGEELLRGRDEPTVYFAPRAQHDVRTRRARRAPDRTTGS